MTSTQVERVQLNQRSWIYSARLVLISFLSLYFELTLIRWIPTQVRLLAYFTNFVLVAALLGLGVGMLLAVRRFRLLALFPAGLLVLTLVVLGLERSNFVLPIVSGGWFYFIDLRGKGALAYIVLVAFFLIMVSPFVLVGQEVGRELRHFRRPLIAYSLNILGSLLGVLGFALVSHLEVPPTIWFSVGAVGFGLYLVLLTEARRLLFAAAVPLVLVVVAVYLDDADHPSNTSIYYSQYYQIQVGPQMVGNVQIGYNIKVNKDNHQYALDLSGKHDWLPNVAARHHQYNLSYSFVHPKRVLVFGAGTGNDVAVALRDAPGATIDAVEIDPTIARLGRQLHPNRPYDSPRVRLHVDDARSYLQRTSQKYDLIVFGLLDSHRVFSQMSSVRLDNFVYTRENFETVRDHLRPGGIVAVAFSVPEIWIANRIYTLLDHVFGHPPLVWQGNLYTYGTIFLAGPHQLTVPPGAPRISHDRFVNSITRSGKYTWRYTWDQGFLQPQDFSTSGPQLTDDWPYLYLDSRTIPPNYLIVLVLTVLVSVLLVWLTVPRISFRTAANWNFLFLGAAFALQETKGITDIALLFGSTWITNIIVISAILVVILVANLVVTRMPALPLPWVYAALFATLLFNYTVPLNGLLHYGFWVQVFASGLRVAAPLFFSGIIFARWFDRADNPSSALGANLMGAVVGGLAEYSSLALGLRQLYLIAMLFYMLSFALASPAMSIPGVRHIGSPAPSTGE